MRLSIRSSILLWFLLANHFADAQERFVLRGGTLIDGTGKAPVANATIVIEGNRIRSIQSGGQVPPDLAQARVLDVSNRFIVPGFIDVHIHYYHWLPEVLLAHGITTIMDLGTVAEWIFAQKEAVAQGKIKGPRILCVGASLELPSDPERALGVADLEEAVRVIREMRGKGADGIKVYRRITVDLLRGMAEEAHRLGMPVAIHIQDAITAREAVEAGVDLIVHAGGLAASMVKEPSLRQRFQAERIPWLFEGSEDPWYLIDSAEIRNFAQWMASRKVYLNPTSTSVWKGIAPGQAERDRDVLRLFTNHALSYIPRTSHGVPDLADISYLTLWLDNWRFEAMSQEERERARKSYDKFKEFLRAFAAAGGKLLPGSDPVGSGVPGIGFHHEMEMLVEAGLSPMQVLQGATQWSAEYLGKLKELGTVEPGKLADLVVLNKNPLSDIRNTRSIETVIQNGKVVDTAYHADFYNPLPRPPLFLPNRSQVARMRPALEPDAVTEGATGFTLRVRSGSGGPSPGSGVFLRNSVVYLKGEALPTRFVSPTQLEAQIPPDRLKPGTYPVTVLLPGARGGMTRPAYLIVKFR